MNKGFRRSRAFCTLVLILIFMGTTAILGLRNYINNPVTSTAELKASGPFLLGSKQLRPLHLAKTPPASNDWLATHDEPGQTFGQYFHSFPNKPTETQKNLYIQPLGEFQPKQHELIRETAELMTRYYNLPTKILESVDLLTVPGWARRNSMDGPQLLTTYILHDILKPARPEDAVAVLGLTTVDLWPGDRWNFVFGQAIPTERVGVWSISRYGNPNESEGERQKYRERTFKVALHETGHMLGMSHCIYFECLMNGSNHLAEMDSRPFWLCPKCVRKVWWNCKVDPTSRYKLLIDFASQKNLQDEQEFWLRSISALE